MTPQDAAAAITSRCLALRIRLLERAVTSWYAQGAAAHGLSVPQVSLLAAITGHPGARASDLSAALLFDRSTLSRTLKGLTDKGLITSKSGHGRARHLFPTPEGEHTLLAAFEDWQTSQAHAEEALGAEAQAIHEIARRLSPVVS
ncbi:MAG: MarR family winged helix-turn-helix transcriptional regulator [Myxococcales bacterium]|nr:MarR family winged helix-turn-helix transcriptional regulator [Myxococcales bacterium]